MDTNYLENNYLTLVGKVTGEKKFSHEIYGEKFYVFNLSIPRLSGNADIIPITISERLITDEMLSEGRKLLIKGQFRSYNSYENERNKLILTVFAKDVEELEYEAGIKVFYNMPPLDEREKSIHSINAFLCRLGFIKQENGEQEKKNKLLVIYRISFRE